MGRKPRFQHRRHRLPFSPAPQSPRALRKIYQCQWCGALVDPMYVAGEDSWCPSCHNVDSVSYAEGHIPDPALYGRWLAMHNKGPEGTNENSPTIPDPDPISFP